MTFNPGHKKVGGRVKGTPNKLTGEIRTIAEEALSQLGGVDYLVGVGREKPAVFLGLVAKLIPSEVRASIERDSIPLVEIRDYTGRQPGVVRRVESPHTAVGAD